PTRRRGTPSLPRPSAGLEVTRVELRRDPRRSPSDAAAPGDALESLEDSETNLAATKPRSMPAPVARPASAVTTQRTRPRTRLLWLVPAALAAAAAGAALILGGSIAGRRMASATFDSGQREAPALIVAPVTSAPRAAAAAQEAPESVEQAPALRPGTTA